MASKRQNNGSFETDKGMAESHNDDSFINPNEHTSIWKEKEFDDMWEKYRQEQEAWEEHDRLNYCHLFNNVNFQ